MLGSKKRNAIYRIEEKSNAIGEGRAVASFCLKLYGHNGTIVAQTLNLGKRKCYTKLVLLMAKEIANTRGSEIFAEERRLWGTLVSATKRIQTIQRTRSRRSFIMRSGKIEDATSDILKGVDTLAKNLAALLGIREYEKTLFRVFFQSSFAQYWNRAQVQSKLWWHVVIDEKTDGVATIKRVCEELMVKPEDKKVEVWLNSLSGAASSLFQLTARQDMPEELREREFVETIELSRKDIADHRVQALP